MEFDWSTKTKQFYRIRFQQFRHRTKNLLATTKRYWGKGIQLVDDFEQVTCLFVLLGETTNNINSAKWNNTYNINYDRKKRIHRYLINFHYYSFQIFNEVVEVRFATPSHNFCHRKCNQFKLWFDHQDRTGIVDWNVSTIKQYFRSYWFCSCK